MKKHKVKSLLVKFFLRVIGYFKPLIRLAAEEADIKLNYPWTGTGLHPVIFADKEEVYKQLIPKSTIFNTRSGKIVVGNNCVFGEEVMLLTGKHKFISEINNLGELHNVPLDGRDIIIGNHCYIGSGAIVIGPVSIGDYAVVGAGSVVTKNVVTRTLVAGIPANKIKDL